MAYSPLLAFPPYNQKQKRKLTNGNERERERVTEQDRDGGEEKLIQTKHPQTKPQDYITVPTLGQQPLTIAPCS